MKIKINDTAAVSEIIGAIVLLAIAVSVFSIIYINVLSDEGPSPNAFVTIIGKIGSNGNINNTVVFENNRGETLGLDTNVILEVGGSYGSNPNVTIKQLSKIFPYLLDGWNIGEKIYPLLYFSDKYGDLKNVTINGNIVDNVSNSIVFWGRLHEGYVVPPFGRGGIWRFNESFWNGTALEVKDSSGNENHGTAHNDANTTEHDIVSSLANKTGIFNVIDYDDYVEVADAYSLDITDNITMEAWIRPFSDSSGDTITLLDQFGYTPYITNISGGRYVFAVVSEDKQKLNLQTVNLTPHHQLSENSIIDIEYNIGDGKLNQYVIRPIITHISDNVYVVAYNNMGVNDNLNVNLKTFNISSNGYINYTGNKIFDGNESNIGEPNRPSIVKVSDFESYSIFAIAYCIYVDDFHPSVGIIKTVNISHDGKIKYTGKMANFDDVEGYGPSIIHVAGEVFAIAYRNTSNLGVVKTFDILSDGSITYTGKEFVFDDIKCYEPSIINIASDVFAIAYRGPSDNGILKTFNISSDGTVLSTVSKKTFESSDCFDPYIIHHSENYYIIVYSTPQNNPHGNYSVIEIAKNGSIVLRSNHILNLTFQNNQKCFNPIAFKISERSFGIICRGQAGGKGHPGYLIPIQIEYPSDVYSKGIYKLGSYGIYANPTKVFVNINTKTINASLGNQWNYVVLTYDRNQMKLYVNGILKSTAQLTEAIKITNSNLIFGDLFYGLIDEVGIYDKVLSDQEVYNHYKLFAPIIISNVNSSDITYSSAIIKWDTNKLSDSIIRYGKTIPPTNTVSDSTWLISHSIALSGLLSKTTYYYEVESTSQDGYTIKDNNGGRYYTFNTENIAPNVPRLPNPGDGNKTGIDIILGWVGGDPENDEVKYDVYLGTVVTTLVRVSDHQLAEFYDPDLVHNTIYYWKIIAWDSYGASTAGPIWSFETIQ